MKTCSFILRPCKVKAEYLRPARGVDNFLINALWHLIFSRHELFGHVFDDVFRFMFFVHNWVFSIVVPLLFPFSVAIFSFEPLLFQQSSRFDGSRQSIFGIVCGLHLVFFFFIRKQLMRSVKDNNVFFTDQAFQNIPFATLDKSQPFCIGSRLRHISFQLLNRDGRRYCPKKCVWALTRKKRDWPLLTNPESLYL